MSWPDCRHSLSSLYWRLHISFSYLGAAAAHPSISIPPFLLPPLYRHVKWEGALVLRLISDPLHHSPSALFTTISLPQRPCFASALAVSDPSFSLSPPLSPPRPPLCTTPSFHPLHPSVIIHPPPASPSLCSPLLNELIRLISGTLLPKPVPTGPAAALRWWLGGSIFRRKQKEEKRRAAERDSWRSFSTFTLRISVSERVEMQDREKEWGRPSKKPYMLILIS